MPQEMNHRKNEKSALAGEWGAENGIDKRYTTLSFVLFL